MSVFDELEKQLEADAVEAENWIPQPGDKLRGTIRSRGTFEGNWGPVVRVRVEDEAGKMWSVLLGGKILADWAADFDPQPGDKMVLQFDGKKQGKNGNEYSAYAVTGVKDGANVSTDEDWT